jgi:hypothetical protein
MRQSIHCGGNDIGIEPCGKLLFDMKFMFFVISQMLLGSKIMFSSILPRLSWRYSEDLNFPQGSIPMSLPPQCINTAYGSPKQLTMLCRRLTTQ